MHDSASHIIVLFDGVCGLCSGAVQFLLKEIARTVFGSLPCRVSLPPRCLNVITSITQNSIPSMQFSITESRTKHSWRKATRYSCSQKCSAASGVSGRLGTFIPRPIRNSLYDFVARHRYRVFGKHETCMLPDPRQQHKFVKV